MTDVADALGSLAAGPAGCGDRVVCPLQPHVPHAPPLQGP
jgi:hypothetical protein